MTRLRDVLLTLLALPVVLPLLAVTALVVKRFVGSPVLFWQERAGWQGAPFVMIKFRTMSEERGSNGELLADALRLGKVGRWLRASSLDELPSLWNVLRGEMSLVGPRPLPTAYTFRYSPEQARRLNVRPGLTGWAQVHGRNRIPWADRLKMDVWYVDHRSLWLDWAILARTLIQLLRSQDVAAPGHATMPPFEGTDVTQ